MQLNGDEHMKEIERIQESVSGKAKENLITYAKKNKQTQGEALDAILLKLEE